MRAWTSKAIHTSRNTVLEEFNHLVLQNQDDAYCLAYYMLGNEAQAVQVVQTAVEQAYKNFKAKNLDFRILLLQLVSTGCLKFPELASNPAQQSGPLQNQMNKLPGTERLTLILIDMLGLSYAQAVQVLHLSLKDVRILLTQGRLRLNKS